MKIRRILAVLVVSAVAGAGALVLQWHTLSAFARAPFNRDANDTIWVTVPPGASAQKIAALLEERGVIGDRKLFHRFVKSAQKEQALKAGDYELSPTMTPAEIVDALVAGRPAEVRFTVREGLRKEEVADVIARAGFGSAREIVALMNDPKLIAAFGVPANVPGGVDGYLFPDTYQFPRGTPPEKVLRRMRQRLDELVDARMQRRMRELGWSLHETLTLASIVEKETGAAHERARVAAVFHNRLAKKMRLQTDPTVIYGIANFDGNIRKADLRRHHAYNTYVIRGLPPGPIAQPGLASIEAALFPASTNDLYFVARGDGGEHEFCPTLECHNGAVRRLRASTAD